MCSIEDSERVEADKKVAFTTTTNEKYEEKKEIIHTYCMFHGNKQNVQKKKKQVQSLMVKIPYMRHEEKINLISGLNMRMNNSRKQTAYRGARF
ncbi:hypothetical protein BDA96_04G301300 [Sorghum bicolor]|uniref:Uncharacterized protein n=2 Tax=Sorghum bicolor TaxID=4558 RepID=A0A921R773_SORBI|nr:hypothetical protein BDA96_04G301300 [Sorghum bicolor]OQU85637.1 hypothetical protein SORBI_3004G282933 [Sorghum bicolor]